MKLIMQGRLSDCYLLSFRVPQEEVRSLVPAGLTLITRGNWAFWNVVVCKIEKMRPLAFPRGAGFTYHHVAYRLMVECQLSNHTKLQGLYFARSDADDGLMAAMGNCVTNFRFHQSSIQFRAKPESFSASVITADEKADLRFTARPAAKPLPHPGAIFETEADRRTFLKYRPAWLQARMQRKFIWRR